MADLTGHKFGKYELRERLGRGGMADVYKAYQPGMDRFVAVKLLHGHLATSPDFIERFKREAQSVGQLRHPHILQVIDFDNEGDVYYMVMEYIRGDTLKAYIQHQGALPTTEALTIAEKLADSLDYAHRRGMIHRDIKPANVMFTDEAHKNPVLTDFGIARILDASGLTATGAFVGTPAYMSPEAGRSEPVDERSDIYSLGVMLYEMLAGRVPYDADTPFAVVMKHINTPLPSIRQIRPDIPDSVEKLLLKALTKDPNDRYQTASDFRDAIHQVNGALPATQESVPRRTDVALEPTLIESTPQTYGEAFRRTQTETAKKFPLVPIIGVIVVILAIIIGGVVFLGDDESQDEAESDNNTTEVAQGDIEDTPTDPASTATAASETPSTDVPTTVAGSAELLSEQGFELQEAGDLDAAITAFDGALELDPNYIDAYIGRGEIYLDQEQFADALRDFNRAFELGSEDPYAYAGRGIAYLNLGEYEKAIEDLDSALQQQTNSEWLAERGFAHEELGNHDAALADFDRALELDPDAVETVAARGMVKLDLERFDEAIADLTAALEAEPDEAYWLSQRGRAFLWSGDPESALADFDRALEIDPDLQDIYGDRGTAYAELGRSQEAMNDFNRAIRIDPENLYLYFQRGWVSYNLSNYDAAIDDFSRVLETAPEDTDALIGRAWSLVAVGRYDESLADVDSVLKLDETNTEARRVRASVFSSQGNFEQALIEYNQILEIDPTQSDIHIGRGDVYMGMEDYQQAIAEYTAAIDGGLQQAYVYTNRAYAYQQANDFDRAIADYTHAIELDSEFWLPYEGLGSIYRRQGDGSQAISNYERAVELNPDSAAAQEALAELYYLENRFEESLAHYEVFLKLAGDEADPAIVARVDELREQFSTIPDSSAMNLSTRYTAYLSDDDPMVIRLANEIADIGFNQGREEALQRVNETLRDYPDNPILLTVRSELYLSLGLQPEALADAEAARDANPAHPAGYLALSRYYFFAEDYDYEQAFELAEMALNLTPDQQEVVLHYAASLYRVDRYDEAVEAYNRAERLGAPLLVVLGDRGNLLWERGHYAEALPDFERLFEINDRDTWTLYRIMGIHILLGQEQQALVLANEYHQAFDDPQFNAVIAYVAYRANSDDLATEWANTALAFDGNQVGAYYVLGLIAARAGDTETALQQFTRLEAFETWQYNQPYLNPTFGHALPLDIARIYVARGEDERANEYFNRTIENYSGWHEGYMERARWRYERGQVEDAFWDYWLAAEAARYYSEEINLAIFQELFAYGLDPTRHAASVFVQRTNMEDFLRFINLTLETYPNDPVLLARRAESYLNIGEYASALVDAQAALESDPNHPAGYVALSMYYEYNGQPDEWLEAAEQAYAIGPNNPDAILNYANTLRNFDGDVERILALYTEAETAEADLETVLSERASFAGQYGLYPIVIEDLTRLLEINHYWETVLDLAGAYIMNGQPAEALTVAEQNSEYGFDNPELQADYLGNLAYVAYRASNFDLARTWLEMGRESNADSPIITYMDALLARQAGDYEVALARLEALSSVEEWRYDHQYLNDRYGHRVSIDIARVYRAMGNTEQALAYYQDLPYNALFYVERADYYLELENTEAARQDFIQALEITDDPELESIIRERIVELGPAPSE